MKIKTSELVPRTAREALISAPSLRPGAAMMWRYVCCPGNEGVRQIINSWKPKYQVVVIAPEDWPEATWFTRG